MKQPLQQAGLFDPPDPPAEAARMAPNESNAKAAPISPATPPQTQNDSSPEALSERERQSFEGLVRYLARR